MKKKITTSRFITTNYRTKWRIPTFKTKAPLPNRLQTDFDNKFESDLPQDCCNSAATIDTIDPTTVETNKPTKVKHSIDDLLC